MKVVILAGGFGTRLSEYTESIPKPMVTVGGKPILWHIMNRYASYGHKDFVLALGYKAEVVKNYFLSMSSANSDFTLDMASGQIQVHDESNIDWKVTLVDTGLETMTGGRVKRLQKYVGNDPFMLTYGDGLSDVNFDELTEFHKSHGKLLTVSAVRPIARFGELSMEGDLVTSFQEKPQVTRGWINGGFFVCQSEIFDYIDNDDTILEREPLETISNQSQLMAFRHDGFWQCMDTKRDKDFLEELWKKKQAPWWI
jgi:glucose-1-phosphate cytidylyltransferase